MLTAQSPSSETTDTELAQQIENRMTESRKIDFTQMRQITKEEVLVVKGQYDEIEKVLDAFKIPYQTCEIAETDKIDLKQVKIILINCYHSRPTTANPQPVFFTNQSVKVIRDFVGRGGFLFASDWALADLIPRAFPNTIAWNSRGTKDETVHIKPKEENKNHPFLKDVFPASGELEWKLDDNSTPVVIKAKDVKPIQVLVESDELKKSYDSEIIAVTFDYTNQDGQNRLIFVPTPTARGGAETKPWSGPKHGTVLYVVSHFYQRGIGLTNAEGNGSMFQLIINFLVKAKTDNSKPR